MPLDPWIIEEIKKREREQREERERQQPTVEIDDREPLPDAGDRQKPGHEMPVERKPGYEMPNPNESSRPAEKKDDEPKRGVDISRITGGDDEDDGTIDIKKEIEKLEKQAPPERKPADSPQKPPEKKPD